MKDLAVRINREHAACLTATRSAVRHAWECGKLLHRQKKSLEHGEWLPWLKKHVKFSEARAQTYMRIANLKSRELAGFASIEAVLKALAREAPEGPPLTPAEARAQEKLIEEIHAQHDARVNNPYVRQAEARRPEEVQTHQATTARLDDLAVQIVKEGYRALAQKLHPDHVGGSAATFAELAEARKRLEEVIHDGMLHYDGGVTDRGPTTSHREI